MARRTVLVVEDNPAARGALVDLLRAAGHVADEAADGREALAYLWRFPPPDLIVLDLLMPVMDGWSFCEALRADPTLPDVPVVICSGAPSRVVHSGGLALDACAYLPKPVNPEALLDLVARVC